MHYMFLIYLDEQAAASRPADVVQASVAAHAPYIEMLRRNGQYAASGRLLPSHSGRALRTAAGKPVVTEGPFAESREQFGGFYLVNAEDLDQAIELAGQCPALGAVAAAIEVRPVKEMLEVPAGSAESAPRWRFGLRAPATTNEGSRFAESLALVQLRESGRLASAATLASAGSATTVRLRGDEAVLADGPFADGSDPLVAYRIIRAADIAEATQLAMPTAAERSEAIEIRGFAPT